MRYGFEWTPGLVLLGAVVVFPVAPWFAMIALLVLALGLIAAVVALAGAIVATPYLLVRHARRHLAERDRGGRRGLAVLRAQSRLSDNQAHTVA